MVAEVFFLTVPPAGTETAPVLVQPPASLTVTEKVPAEETAVDALVLPVLQT